MTNPNTTTEIKIENNGAYYTGGYVFTGAAPLIPAILGDCKGYTYSYPPVTSGLNALHSDVKKFHVAFGHPAPNAPTMLTQERIAARAKWIREEVQEMEDAETLVDQVDACIDQIYFAVGTLVELGVSPQAFWDIVQNANMAKLGPDGKPLYHPDGKTRKPEGWQAPEPKLLEELNRQIERSKI